MEKISASATTTTSLTSSDEPEQSEDDNNTADGRDLHCIACGELHFSRRVDWNTNKLTSVKEQLEIIFHSQH